MSIKLPSSEHEYLNMITGIVEITTLKVLAETGAIKENISLREAQRRYGAGTVRRWREEGLIEFQKDGPGTSCIRINRMRIEAVSKMSNRDVYRSSRPQCSNVPLIAAHTFRCPCGVLVANGSTYFMIEDMPVCPGCALPEPKKRRLIPINNDIRSQRTI